eukprot:UN24453
MCVNQYLEDLSDVKTIKPEWQKDYEQALDYMRIFMSQPIKDIHRRKRSDQEIIIDAGPGTTATRTLTAVLKQFGINCVHQGLGEYGRQLKIDVIYDRLSIGEECYNYYDQQDFRFPDKSYDCLTDNPFPAYFWDMYWAYPNAKFLITTREPHAWIE